MPIFAQLPFFVRKRGSFTRYTRTGTIFNPTTTVEKFPKIGSSVGYPVFQHLLLDAITVANQRLLSSLLPLIIPQLGTAGGRKAGCFESLNLIAIRGKNQTQARGCRLVRYRGSQQVSGFSPTSGSGTRTLSVRYNAFPHAPRSLRRAVGRSPGCSVTTPGGGPFPRLLGSRSCRTSWRRAAGPGM